MMQSERTCEESVVRAVVFPQAQRRWSAFLFTLIDPFSEPALVYGAEGQLVVCNRAAAARFPVTPDSVAAARALASARSIVVEFEGAIFDLVVLPLETRKTGPSALPESLARVAELAALGLPDKEISERTGLSLSSTRTYVARLYRRLGVRNRAELARHLQAARSSSAVTP